MATETGLARFEPIQRNQAVPARAAVLIVPQTSARSPRSAVAHADEADYRARLRQLGFDVFVIGPGSRPEIDRFGPQAAAALPSSSDIVVFVLGQVLAQGSGLYVIPDDAAIGLETSRQDNLATEGLPLSDLLRRISGRNPRSLLAFVDECRRLDRPAAPCSLDAVSDLDAGIIAVHRTAPASTGAPNVVLASARGPMLALMTAPGTNALQLFSALRERLAGSDLSVTATRSLPPLFAFRPADFFSRLSHDCNGIDPAADAEKVRHTNIEPLIEACTQAIRQWPFVSHFERQRAAGVEQQTFLRSSGNCDDVPAIVEYVVLYPAGRFRLALEEFVARCDTSRGRSRLPRTRITGRGWELVYDATILRRIALDADTGQPDGAVRSTWHSVEHGTDAVMTLVIGANTDCLAAQQYLDKHIVPLRRDLRWSEEIGARGDTPRGVLIHSSGSRSGAEPEQTGVQSIDAVLVPTADRSSYVHLNVRFEMELAFPIIDEFQRIAESIKMTDADSRRTACPGP